MLQLHYILNKILDTKFPPCKYKILPWWGISPWLRTHELGGFFWKKFGVKYIRLDFGQDYIILK